MLPLSASDAPSSNSSVWIARAGWLAFAALAAVGVPLFLRMPLWIDITLYDLAARAILTGGVHYRDVFDTNPPGFVWTLCLVRLVFGPSLEAVRAVDLAVIGAVAGLLLRWARMAGATPAGIAWTAAAFAGFYLFLPEFNHCQRDVWMMLPAVGAIAYRLHRVKRMQAEPKTEGWVFRTAVIEGMIWGLAAWVKPHVLPVAAAAWLVTQARLAGTAKVGRRAKSRRSGADFAGAFAGGSLVGAAGVAWLLETGTWPYLLDVFTHWNTGYVRNVLAEFGERWPVQLDYFPPWSLLLIAAVPLAVANVVAARPWAVMNPVDDRRFTRGVLAAVYLTWAGIALVLQRHYPYVHIPETLLMLALFAANRWPLAGVALAVQVGVMTWLAAASETAPRWETQPKWYQRVVWRYPDRFPNRLVWWPGCFARVVSPELRNGVAFQPDHFAGMNWVELDEVEAYLRSRGVKEGDASVLCWHNTPHALYLMMNLRPPIRFMHLSTAAGMSRTACERVRAETVAAVPGVRFVVSDLRWAEVFFPPDWQARSRECGPHLLPPLVPIRQLNTFPFNQPAVFRSGGGHGRYLVHELRNPVGELDVPGWPRPWE